MPTKNVQTVDIVSEKPKNGKQRKRRTKAEIEAARMIVITETHQRAFDTHGLRQGNPGNNPHVLGKRRLKLAKQLSDLIREIGEEVIDPQKGWTRLEAVVRRVYSDALSGKPAQQALLFERGWGKVPTPIQLDMRAEVLNLMESTGLTVDELSGDPVLKEIMGKVIEGELVERGK